MIDSIGWPQNQFLSCQIVGYGFEHQRQFRNFLEANNYGNMKKNI